MKKDKKQVMSCLRTMPDNSVVCTKPFKVHFPMRFEQCNIAYIDQEVQALGFVNLICNDEFYCVLCVNAMVRFTPSKTTIVEIEGDKYYELQFPPGSVLIKTLELVKVDTIVYDIYNEFLANGNLPYYADYEGLASLYNTALKHAGANIGTQAEVTELIISTMARWPNDRNTYYRQAINAFKGTKVPAPTYVPIESVHSASDTVSRLGGAYFETGVKLAINTPSTRVERIEDALRR